MFFWFDVVNFALHFLCKPHMPYVLLLLLLLLFFLMVGWLKHYPAFSFTLRCMLLQFRLLLITEFSVFLVLVLLYAAGVSE